MPITCVIEGLYKGQKQEQITDDQTKQTLNFNVYEFCLSLFVDQANLMVPWDKIKDHKTNQSFWVRAEDGTQNEIFRALAPGKPTKLVCSVYATSRNGKGKLKLTPLHVAG